jgi:hypothetical protein
MAQDMLGITNSLFGVQPTFQSDLAQGMQLAGRSATEIGTGLAYAGGRQLGRGLMGATGTEDPEMASASRAKQFAQELQSQGLSMQSAEGMNALAQKLTEAGDFKAAQVAASIANKFASERAGIDLKTAQTQKVQQGIQNEDKLRAELQALGPNATEEQLMAVLQKYGSPDKVIAALQASQNTQARLSQQRDLAESRLDLQRTALSMRGEGMSAREQDRAEKRQEKLDKQAASAKMQIASADRVITEVQEANKMVSGFTAGAGGLLSAIPLTGAKDLASKLTTIKANLGFDRLQQMRDASPTGGALGQVAVQELIALQSTIASLDQQQSPAQLKAALTKIEGHYAAWRDAVTRASQEQPTTPRSGGGGAPKTRTLKSGIVVTEE